MNDSDKLTEILKGVSCTVHMQSNSAGHPSVRGEVTGLEEVHAAILTLFESFVPEKVIPFEGTLHFQSNGIPCSSTDIIAIKGWNNCRTQILKNIGRLRK